MTGPPKCVLNYSALLALITNSSIKNKSRHHHHRVSLAMNPNLVPRYFGGMRASWVALQADLRFTEEVRKEEKISRRGSKFRDGIGSEA